MPSVKGKKYQPRDHAINTELYCYLYYAADHKTREVLRDWTGQNLVTVVTRTPAREFPTTSLAVSTDRCDHHRLVF